MSVYYYIYTSAYTKNHYFILVPLTEFDTTGFPLPYLQLLCLILAYT